MRGLLSFLDQWLLHSPNRDYTQIKGILSQIIANHDPYAILGLDKTQLLDETPTASIQIINHNLDTILDQISLTGDPDDLSPSILDLCIAATNKLSSAKYIIFYDLTIHCLETGRFSHADNFFELTQHQFQTSPSSFVATTSMGDESKTATIVDTDFNSHDHNSIPISTTLSTSCFDHFPDSRSLFHYACLAAIRKTTIEDQLIAFSFLAKLLDFTGININAIDTDGYTPLHHACQQDHALMILFLLNHGASLDITNHQDQTPIELIFTDEEITESFVNIHLQTARSAIWLANHEENLDPEEAAFNFISTVYQLIIHQRESTEAPSIFSENTLINYLQKIYRFYGGSESQADITFATSGDLDQAILNLEQQSMPTQPTLLPQPSASALTLSLFQESRERMTTEHMRSTLK